MVYLTKCMILQPNLQKKYGQNTKVSTEKSTVFSRLMKMAKPCQKSCQLTKTKVISNLVSFLNLLCSGQYSQPNFKIGNIVARLCCITDSTALLCSSFFFSLHSSATLSKCPTLLLLCTLKPKHIFWGSRQRMETPAD